MPEAAVLVGGDVSRLSKLVQGYVELTRADRGVEAIERYYAEDVVVFENRELSRAGRETCAKYERAARARVAAPPTLTVRGIGVDESQNKTFVEWVVRFVSTEGKPFQLEEVAVQKWDGDRISEERFYYEGLVDESDDDHDETAR